MEGTNQCSNHRPWPFYPAWRLFLTGEGALRGKRHRSGRAPGDHHRDRAKMEGKPAIRAHQHGRFPNSSRGQRASTTPLDLTGFASNLHLHRHNAFQNLIVIRGISHPRRLSIPGRIPVADDVCYPSQFMPNLELYDIERAEVLKGPQGTLYGRNAESGGQRIVTKQPGDTFRAKALTEYSSFNTVRTGANLSGPIVEDRLFLGVAGQFKSSDGFMDNQADGSSQTSSISTVAAPCAGPRPPAGTSRSSPKA